MSRTRKALVRLLLVGVAALSLQAIISDRDDRWPFLAYSMFAARRDPEVLRTVFLAGVDARPPHAPVLVNLEPALFTFGGYRLERAFDRLFQRRGPEAAARALADLLPIHERWRQAGLVKGPPLRALRLVRARRLFGGAVPPEALAPSPAFEDPRARCTVLLESLP